MIIKDIVRQLEELAPPSYQESYDNSGLLTGSPSTEVTGILLCLDVIEEVVEDAIKKGCNLIVAHHPIIFKGLKKLNGKNYVERTVIKAIRNDVAIYAIHTNLDNVHLGVNFELGQRLGLENLKTLAPKSQLLSKLQTYCPEKKAEEVRQALFAAGAGKIGEYDHCSFNTSGEGSFRASDKADPYVGKVGETHYEKEVKIECIFPNHLSSRILQALFSSHPYEEVAYEIFRTENKHQLVGSGMIGELREALPLTAFFDQVKSALNVSCIRHTRAVGDKVKRIAICGGAGSFLLPAAKALGADVFLTGDFKYHEFFNAEDQIVIADVGHYESEQFTPHLLGRFLKEKFPNFAIHLTDCFTNPVNYY